MSLGFDSSNLDAAVARVMALAGERNQTRIWFGNNNDEYSLTDANQVRNYLMAKSEDVYLQQGPGAEGQIMAVVYFSIGVVFESNVGEMHPPPVTRAEGRPTHLAYFWQTL